MADNTKILTMQDLMEQNAELVRINTGLLKVMEDFMYTMDREIGQLWEYVLPRKGKQ